MLAEGDELDVWVTHPAHPAKLAGTLTPSGTPQTLDVELPAEGRTAQGAVELGDGTPVVGAQVVALGPGGVELGAVATAPDGTFSLYGLPPVDGLKLLVAGHRLTTDDGGVIDLSAGDRSEEHTSELQSLMRNSSAVFCLKKKKNKIKAVSI